MPRDILWLSPVPNWESDLGLRCLGKAVGEAGQLLQAEMMERQVNIWMNDLATSLVSNGAMQSGLWLSGPHVLLISLGVLLACEIHT